MNSSSFQWETHPDHRLFAEIAHPGFCFGDLTFSTSIDSVRAEEV
jgi:hypothetical protein